MSSVEIYEVAAILHQARGVTMKKSKQLSLPADRKEKSHRIPSRRRWWSIQCELKIHIPAAVWCCA